MAASMMRADSQCLIYWPSKLEPYRKQRVAAGKPSTEPTRFLIGWNPRGTVVCIADIVFADNAEEADSEVRRLRSAHRDIMPGLRLLGRLHAQEGGASVVELPSDDGARARRNTAELWMELVDGPGLVDLYVCGMRIPTQLFVVHYKPEQPYRTTPSRLSAVSRLGYDGVKRALQGDTASSLWPGAISRVEGHFLPPHHSNLNILTRPTTSARSESQQFGNNSSLTDHNVMGSTGSIESMTASPQRKTSGLGGAASDEAAAPMLGNDSMGNPAVSPGLGGVVDGELPDAYIDDWSADDVDSKKPPRLSAFPTWGSTTELSRFLRGINQARELRKTARNPSYVPYADDGADDTKLKVRVRRAIEACRGGLLTLLACVTFLARFSYVFSVFEFKLREFLCGVALVSHHASACGLHAFVPHSFPDDACTPAAADIDMPPGAIPKQPGANTRLGRVERRTCLSSYVARTAADLLLGICLCIVLTAGADSVKPALRELAWWGIHDLHIAYIDWFKGWPAGFKLNDELNDVVSVLSQAVFSLWVRVITAVDVDWMRVGMTLWIACSSLGVSFGIAFVADVCNVVTLHIRTLLHLMSVPYRVVLAVISSLLLQFRGKRRNPLRSNRVDDWLFQADEMILGLLIGTVTIFAAPTIAMYYIYFAVARTVIWVLQETLRGVAMLFCFIPVYPLFLWLSARNAMPTGVAFGNLRVRTAEVVSSSGNSVPQSPAVAASPSMAALQNGGAQSTAVSGSAVVEVDLQPRPMMISEAVAEISVVARFVLESALNPARIMHFVFQAHAKPILDIRGSVFAHLTGDPAHPRLSAGNRGATQ